MSNRARESNARLGIRLFWIYSAFYLGFVLVNAFAAEWSEWTPLAGLNLAVLWGFGLIGLAFVLALVYGWNCQPDPMDDASGSAPDAPAEKST